MRKFKSFLIVASSLLLILSGCGGGGGSGSNNRSSNDYSRNLKVVDIPDKDIEVVRLENSQDTRLKLNISQPKDVYIVVTSHFDSQRISINRANIRMIGGQTIDDLNSSKEESNNSLDLDINDTSPITKKIMDFRDRNKYLLEDERNSSSLLSRVPNMRLASEGDKEYFCVDIDYNYDCSKFTQASVKKVVTSVETKYGDKNLVVWLEDGEEESVSQELIDELAKIFLYNGKDDIYSWVSNIYGKEWGESDKDNLISPTDTIHILLYDMGDDRIAGFFWEKDNYIREYVGGSNEKIMFYINSKIFTRSDYSLDENKKEVFTTLVHEFQHMIYFYQRNVLKGIYDQSWFNEMLSEATEDLISVKIRYKGPRNVDPEDGTAGEPNNDGGRYPYFNYGDYIALTYWNNDIFDYAKVSSFGAYLLRNYGAEVLRKISSSDKIDEFAIMDATGENNFFRLISNWGVGVILSDRTDLTEEYPQYNFGDFKYTEYDGVTYKLGSINFYNYILRNSYGEILVDGPLFLDDGVIDKNGNLYYKVGSNLSGEVTLDINIPRGGDITVIAK